MVFYCYCFACLKIYFYFNRGWWWCRGCGIQHSNKNLNIVVLFFLKENLKTLVAQNYDLFSKIRRCEGFFEVFFVAFACLFLALEDSSILVRYYCTGWLHKLGSGDMGTC